LKKLLLSILFIASIFHSYAKITLAVSDITLDERFLEGDNGGFYTEMLFRNLYPKANGKDYTYLLARTIGNKNVTDWKVKNEIDAFAVIDNLDLNFLIYGNVSTGDTGFASNFKIYSRKDERVVKEIDYDSPLTDRQVFIKEAAFKIDIAVYEYFARTDTVNVDKINDEIDDYNRDRELKDRFRNFRLYEYLGFNFSTGYAVPCGEWSSLFLGIVNFETGIRIVRIPPVFDNKKFFKISFRPGFTFSYTLSKNKPEIVEEYFHSFSFRFPAEFLFIFKNKFAINANVDIHARLDHFYQNLYGIRKNFYTTAAFGWTAGAGFEYEVDKDGIFTVGINNYIDFAIYDVFYFDFKIQTYFLFKIKEAKTTDKIDTNEIKIKL
jgi:hypothetical protein